MSKPRPPPTEQPLKEQPAQRLSNSSLEQDDDDDDSDSDSEQRSTYSEEGKTINGKPDVRRRKSSISHRISNTSNLDNVSLDDESSSSSPTSTGSYSHRCNLV